MVPGQGLQEALIRVYVKRRYTRARRDLLRLYQAWQAIGVDYPPETLRHTALRLRYEHWEKRWLLEQELRILSISVRAPTKRRLTRP